MQRAASVFVPFQRAGKRLNSLSGVKACDFVSLVGKQPRLSAKNAAHAQREQISDKLASHCCARDLINRVNLAPICGPLFSAKHGYPWSF